MKGQGQRDKSGENPYGGDMLERERGIWRL